MRLDSENGTDHEVFGRYCDVFERRQDALAHRSRKVVYDSTRTQPSSNHLRQLVGVIGRRDVSDPVFGMAAKRQSERRCQPSRTCDTTFDQSSLDR